MAELSKIKIVTLNDLEDNLGTTRFPNFVQECEDEFWAQIDTIVAEVLHRPNLKLIFVSGPTSSGKTTFTSRLADLLAANNRKTYTISMDDYYRTEEFSFDDKGRPDYESISTLDLDLFVSQVGELLAGKEVQIPSFVFKSRSRIYEPSKEIKLGPSDLLIVEGLHGLAAEVVKQIDREKALGIFIMPYMRFFSDDHLLDSRDLRKLRRISRDVNHRGATAMSTLDYWPMIDWAEQNFVGKYLKEADYYINSALPYELCMVVPFAKKQLKISRDQYLAGELPPSTSIRQGLFYADLNTAFKEAQRLIKACEIVPEVGKSLVPARSILHEFI